ncbi:MAG: hypothetical protein ACXAB4_13025, partial [Candidatus Hodarchaeales archaeon]
MAETAATDSSLPTETFDVKTSWRLYLSRFKRNRASVVGLAILLIFMGCAVTSFLDEFLLNTMGWGLLPYGPGETFAGGAHSKEEPSLRH